jgi:hypothetical protein
MRKITQDLASAFQAHNKKTLGNTHTDGQALYLHGNKIAEYRSDGLYVSSAGWKTKTTKERLNGLSGVSVSQEAGEWYLNGHKWSGDFVRVENFTGNVKDSDTEKDKKTLKKIKAYSTLYENNEIYPLIPSGGDCWFCALREVENRIPLGDLHKDNAHLIDHMSENYVMGSLALNALREAGYHEASIGVHLHGFARKNVQRAVYKYMKKRLTNLAR